MNNEPEGDDIHPFLIGQSSLMEISGKTVRRKASRTAQQREHWVTQWLNPEADAICTQLILTLFDNHTLTCPTI